MQSDYRVMIIFGTVPRTTEPSGKLKKRTKASLRLLPESFHIALPSGCLIPLFFGIGMRAMYPPVVCLRGQGTNQLLGIALDYSKAVNWEWYLKYSPRGQNSWCLFQQCSGLDPV